ncbi:AsnC family transcriptional regulator [Cryobacterium sp. MLB-32]|uniref:Lrp/AsnC family transcriptional regulator n=1 Tax=Cryobacterium sp. MLB-32 TaxID=1529318 RepID=UPI0004E6DC2F|nr:Lrp/AsnC family transcriptional regulator [Cryobacterium sp. MLB-32]KFF60904.1 AsnC family transcriptional regulator [Cryobacterium sp. MLB-32]
MTTAASVHSDQPLHLDTLSRHIIEQLQADGRRSYAEIGKAVGLSEAAVRQRVQKLTDARVVQVVAVINPDQLGFDRRALIGITASGDTRVIADQLARLAAVGAVVLTAGSFDILVEVICTDDSALLEVLNSQIRTLPGVVSTETFVYLTMRSQFHDWALGEQ